MEEKRVLYIPTNIRRRKEIIAGFGKEEVIITSIAVGIGLVAGMFMFMIKGNSTGYLIGVPLIIGSMTAVAVKKNFSNISMIDSIKNIYHFSFKSQKSYYYKYYNIYEMEMNQIKKKNEKADPKVVTANEFVDVKDIHNNLLFTKSGYVIGYLRIYPINIDLMSQSELESTTKIQTSMFKAEKDQFDILVIPRSVDMDEYLDFLSDHYDQEISDINKKKILNVMIQEVSKKIMGGQNYEHQFFLRVIEKYNPTNSIEIERKISDRLMDFENRYQAIKIQTSRLSDTDVIRLCNLFSNGLNAVYETYEGTEYIPIPRMRGAS